MSSATTLKRLSAEGFPGNVAVLWKINSSPSHTPAATQCSTVQGHQVEWTMECEKAFREAKEVLSSTSVLAHYDPQTPL